MTIKGDGFRPTDHQICDFELNDKLKESSQQTFTNHEDLALALVVAKMDVFNYAFYENDIAPIRGLRIINQTGNPIDGLSIRISSDFNFFNTYEKFLPSIPSGKPIDLPDPHLIINGRELAGLTETINAEILVELCKEGEAICGVREQMQVLAYDQWQGGETYRNLLSAFVLPNHPIIPALMHDASDRLKKWGKDAALEGYQSHDPNRVRDLAAAAYAAIQKKNIVYAEPPASFSVIGQRIRTPETIMEQRLATCMDMTLLYAALLEAMGLHPLLVMLTGHIFVGVWLKERSEEELKVSDIVIDNLEQLTMRIDNGTDELTFVECTAMCSGKNVNFEEAEMAAKQKNLNPERFEYAIDLYLSRVNGIKPIASRMKQDGEYQIEVTEKEEDKLTDAPTNIGLTITDLTVAKPHKIANKRELWESKLLDISTRNMLLNLPTNASIEPIMSSHIDELEDALSDGHEFNLLPAAEWITDLTYTKTDQDGKESKPIQWISEALNECGVFEMTSWPVSADFDFNEKFRQEYRNHRLYTFSGAKQLERELTNIYRAARSSQQENGVSSLYLAVGLLRWFEEENETPCYAPLILLPIEIVRKSANQGYALHARDEEPHFNTTLLEMLKQKFKLDIPGLDPLPADEHGTNIKKVFSIVRSALFTVKNWDVVETCVIGNFSFAQFAMWNDIHSAGDVIENSKIVRSLMKGHIDWDVTAVDGEDNQVYLPITVDDTQLQAIKMAEHGTTFVLHGPPGTGKSQTITGMIANLLAQGKRVLFVAEKMAALSVVQKRLTDLGIGDFCLELHSDKANKKQILTQLDKALAIQHPTVKTEYEEYSNRTVHSRAELDGYAEHLHRKHNCGYSLRELIALYETVRSEDHTVRFDRNRVGNLTEDEVKSHLPLIGQLTAIGEAIADGISGNKLIGVGITSYSSDIRAQLKSIVEQYQISLNGVREAGNKVAVIIGAVSPKNKTDLAALKNFTRLYQEIKGTDPLLLKLLNCDTNEAYGYFEKEKLFLDEEKNLLNDWETEFLSMDMESILVKHEAAGKKFLGKLAAKNQVTAEVQHYCRKQVSFDQIPMMTKRIIEHQEKKKDLDAAYTLLSDVTKSLLKELPDKDSYGRAYESVMSIQKQAEKFPGGLDAFIELTGNAEINNDFEEFSKSIDGLEYAENAINELLLRDEKDDDNWLEEEISFCDYLTVHPAALKDWGLYNHIRQECIKVGLEPVISAYENGIGARELVGAYKKGLYYALINNIILQDDVLSSFSGATFNESIAQFKRMDAILLDQARKEIYYRLASGVPDSWDSPEIGMELNLLRKAIGSNARGMSIRTLFERISHVLPLLTPCMLMSPNSVSQYLKQENDLFDVVIFDEASQLPTCKAVGALFRAKDAVIVGDPKQMPPTSFFSGSGPEVDDLALDDLDSILDDVLALGIPSQHLQWHYRSTHESLIAFSNNQFYDNKMYTFPSANDRERHVTAVHVEGLYSKGTNPKEAEAVVQDIVRRYRDPELNNQSIGVVTFNVKQQTLIEDLLIKQFQNNQKFDAWANNGENPLFVKNLENVQGDERDVILFSIGYGPDEKGRVSNNFGPINKAGGGKRLNVAFSRARVTMTIFSSIYSSDIKLTEASPEGLVAFYNFLKFAEGNDIQTEIKAEKEAKLAKAGIMQNICRSIEAHGYKTETMIGHSDFHVDIAVIDPFEPTKYMMGILLDGDGYRQTKNTRDREVAQISVLKKLGWNLCRVWTIDWWDNRDKEINKLLSKLDQLKDEIESRLEEVKTNEEVRRAEEAARSAEAEKLKAELEAQIAQVLQEGKEADIVQSSIITPVIVSEDDNRNNSTDNKLAYFTIPEKEEKKPESVEDIIVDNQFDNLFQKLADTNAKVIDKRSNGGALWVVGGIDLAPIMKEFKTHGINFTFKAGGGKATGGKDGWWAKTDEVPSKIDFIAEQKIAVDKEKPKFYDLELIDYAVANIDVTPITLDEFVAASNKNIIAGRIEAIADVEAPILKETLMRKVFASFGMGKSKATEEAYEKALRISKVKHTKSKGVIFCWNESQDPKAYAAIRVSSDRSVDEICMREIGNAICYVLKYKGALNIGDLVKEASLLFGYKRLGKNLEAALVVGLQWCKRQGYVISLGGNIFGLAPMEES